MAKTADIIIVGAGVVGCSVAYHLARMGVKGILVLDRGQIGGESSTAAAGMLAPQCEAPGPGPFLDFCLAARRYYERLAPELEEVARTDIEDLDWGILHLLGGEGGAAARPAPPESGSWRAAPFRRSTSRMRCRRRSSARFPGAHVWPMTD